MTRTLPRTLLALALFVASLVAFDRLAFALFECVRPSSRASDLRQKLQTVRDKADYRMLVLGTSRVFEAVHPADIRRELGIKAFKEAYQGKGPRYHYEFYQLYEQIVGRPKWVVYGVDYFMFATVSERWAMEHFKLKEADGNPAYVVPAGPLRMLANKAQNDREIVRQLQMLQRAWLPPPRTWNPEGSVQDMEAYTGTAAPMKPERVVPAGYERTSFPRYPGPEGVFLLKLLDQWQREGVGVLLINTPDYIGTYETNFERQAFDGYFAELARSRPQCEFIDYSEPRRFPLGEARYFTDGGYGNPNSHLSGEGVRHFNRLFLPDLRRFVRQAAH